MKFRLGATCALMVILVTIAVPDVSTAQSRASRPSRPLAVNTLDLGDTDADLVYTPLPVCRIIDTRLSGGPIAAGTERSFLVTGSTGFEAQGGTAGGCGVPTTATAVTINFVAVTPSGSGNLRGSAYPNPVPATGSVLNYQNVTPALNIANGLSFPTCDHAKATCTFDITLFANNAGTQIVADVLGYYKRMATEQLGPVRVTPETLAGTGWEAWNDLCDTVTLTYTNGESTTPPLGTGSFQVTGIDGAGGALATDQYNGPFSALTALRYSTKSEDVTDHPYIYINIDDNGDTTRDRTIYFFPANNAEQGPSTANVWQTWDALKGKWNVDGDSGPIAAATLSNLGLQNSAILGVRIASGCGPATGGLPRSRNTDAVEVGISGNPPKVLNFERN